MSDDAQRGLGAETTPPPSTERPPSAEQDLPDTAEAHFGAGLVPDKTVEFDASQLVAEREIEPPDLPSDAGDFVVASTLIEPLAAQAERVAAGLGGPTEAQAAPQELHDVRVTEPQTMVPPARSAASPSFGSAPARASGGAGRGREQELSRTGELPVIVDAARDVRELAAAARRQLDAAQSDAERTMIHRALAVIFEQRVGDQRRALRHYQQAYRLDPEDLVAVRGARRIFAARENWTMVLSLLDAEARITDSERRAAELLCVKGQVYAERLANLDAARQAFRAALERDAGAAFALTRLRAIYAQLGDDEALSAIGREAVSAARDPRQRGMIYVELGRLHEAGADEDAAIEAYSAAFAEDPSSAEAASALERLYRAKGRFGDLVDVLLTVGDLGEPRAQALCYVAAARICRDRLDQRDRALELLSRARQRHSDPLLLSEMAELLGQVGRYAELAEVLRELLGALVDRGERVVAHHRLGRLYEAHIGDEDAAIEHLRAALRLEPTYVPALQALGRLLARRQDWGELTRMQLAEAESLPEGPARARRLAVIAELFEHKLDDRARALELHERALQIDPSSPVSRRALERLYAADARHDALLSLLEQDLGELEAQASSPAGSAEGSAAGSAGGATEAVAAALGDGPDGGADEQQGGGAGDAAVAEHLTRMAMVAELALHDRQRALSLYERALSLRGDSVGLLRVLGRLYAELGQHEALAAVLEREAALTGDPSVELALRYRVAEIHEELGRRDEALARYRAIIERDPTHVEAASALGRLYQRRGDFEALRELYAAQVAGARGAGGEGQSVEEGAGEAAGDERRAMLLYKAGELDEERLGDVDAAIESFELALAAAPGFRPALQALARLHRRQGNWAALAEALEQRAEGIVDPVERAGLYFALGELAEGRLVGEAASGGDGTEDRALGYYRRAFNLAPSHDPAREALLRLLLSAGSASEAAEVSERALEAAQETSVRVGLLKRLARLYERRLREPERAQSCLERALEQAPDDVEALAALARLRRATGDWAGAADALGQLAAVTDDTDQAVAYLADAAGLVEAFAHEGDAVPFYQRIAELDGHNRAALEALRGIHIARREPQALVAVLSKLLEIERDAPARAALLLSLGVACEALGDIGGTARALVGACEHEPSWLLTRELRRAQTRLGQWVEAGASLELEADLGSDRELAVRALLEAAHIHHEHERDSARVAGALERVLEIEPYHEDAARWLEQVLVKHGEWHRLADVARRRLRHSDGGEANARQRIELISRLAWIEREHLEDAQAAAKTLERAVSIDPHYLPTLLTLAELHVALEQWTEAAQVYGRIVALSDDPDLLRRAHFELGEIQTQRLGDKHQAISSFQNVLAIAPHDTPAMERLRDLFVAAADWDNAADMLERLRDHEVLPERRVEHALSLADIQEREFGDPQMAAQQLAEALDLVPDHDAIVDRIVEVYGRLGQWDAAARALGRHIAALPPDARSRVRRRRLQLADLLHQRLARPDDALVELQRAAQSDPLDLDVRGRVARLLARRGDVDAALREHLAIVGTDPLITPAHLESLRALRTIHQQRGDLTRAYSAAAVLARLGSGGDADERLAREIRPKMTLAPAQHFEPDELAERLRDHEEPLPGHDIIAALGDCAHRLRPPPLSAWQVGKADRLPPRSDDPLKVAVRDVRDVLALNRDVEVYVSNARPLELDLLLTDPPAIVAGSGVVGAMPSWQLRCRIAHALAWVRTRNWIAYDMSPRELAVTVNAACRVYEPDHVDSQLGPGAELTHEVAEMSRQIQRSMSRKTRRNLEEAVDRYLEHGPPHFERWVWAMRRTALRVGLWLTGDFDAMWSELLHYTPAERGGAPEIAELELERDGDGGGIGVEISRYPLLVTLVRFWLSDELRLLRG